jgi:membrane dipeptidase
MRLSWNHLGTPRADDAHGKKVEITGWPTAALGATRGDYFLLTGEPGCCPGCVPNNPLAVVEVFATESLELANGALRLTGTLHVERSDDTVWRYQVRGAKPAGGMTRRRLIASSALVCLPVPAVAEVPPGTVDMHSHAGGIFNTMGNEPFHPVADPMRQGGLAVVCLAIGADVLVTQLDHGDGRIRPFRNPKPGELYEYSKRAFARIHQLVREQRLTIIRDVAGLKAAHAGNPSVIVACEGADFTEGMPDRIDEAYEKWQLRHVQLTHYRPNELGDIQTEAPEHGGLTEAGAAIVRRCNQRGIVVDVAHGTYELVKKAVAVTTKPLLLSHTARIVGAPRPWTRLVTPDHAKAIADTGGVVGIWPVNPVPGVDAYARNIFYMVDTVGIDHVGIGTDQLGLTVPSSLPSYTQLPQLAAELAKKFTPVELAKVLGGNYHRVFEASLA